MYNSRIETMAHQSLRRLVPCICICFVVRTNLASVSKPPVGTFPGSAKLGSTGLIYYEVNEPDIKGTCPLTFLQCHTPRNGSCWSGEGHGNGNRYHVRHNGSVPGLQGSWYCAIEIPNMSEEDVGIYLLCKKDQSIDRCHVKHPTKFGAWYMMNNTICGITFDETLKQRVDNCTFTTTVRPTTHPKISSSTAVMASEIILTDLNDTELSPSPTTDQGEHNIITLEANRTGNAASVQHSQSIAGIVVGTAIVTTIVVLLLELIIYKLYKTFKSTESDSENADGRNDTDQECIPMNEGSSDNKD